MDVTFSMLLEKTSEYLHCAPLQVVRNGMLCAEPDKPTAQDGVYPWDGSHIEHVALCKKSVGDGPSTLYIAGARPSFTETNLFCLAAPASHKAGTDGIFTTATNAGTGTLRPGTNIACFPSFITRTQLFSAALEALSFYHNWANRILDLIYREQGLNAIVSFVYPAFGNPFLIYDSSLKVLSYTKNDGSTDPLWTKTVRSGTVTDLDADAAQELLLYLEKLDQYSQPFKHQSRDLSDPFFSCNIEIGGRRAGMIALMERHHHITPGQLDLLRLLARLLTFELQKDAIRRENTGLIYNQLLLELMEGTVAGPETLRSRLTATRWQVGRSIRTVWFVSGNTFLTEPEWKRIFDQLLFQELDGRGILLKDSIFFLLSGSQPKSEAACRSTLLPFCEKHRLRCGVSDPYTDLLETHRMKNQSQLALRLSCDTVACFSQVRYQNLLAHCLQYPEPREILHPAIALLDRHDRECQTPYLDTLSALFQSQYNQLNAARLLHIHRTTLHYRLQKIVALTGIRLEDAEEMLYLQLSLTLYRR